MGIILFTIPAIFILFCIKNKDPIDVRIEKIIDNSIHNGIVQMIIIFILAGAFSSIMISIDATIAMKSIIQSIIPGHFTVVGIFIASSLIATAMGTSLGTVATMAPVSMAILSGSDNLVLGISAVVAGAYLGDNISMVSDTTIAAIRTQGAKNYEKFIMNLKLITPAVILTSILYFFLDNSTVVSMDSKVSISSIIISLPYIVIIILGLMRIHVFMVIMIGIIMAIALGVIMNHDVDKTLQGMMSGMSSMFEMCAFVILMSVVNSGMKIHGYINKINQLFHASGKISFYISTFIMIVLGNIISANNTISIIMFGDTIASLNDRIKESKNKIATFVDASTCAIHSVLPHAPQILLASEISGIGIFDIIMHSYYSLFIVLSLIFYALSKK
jgi:Na+/H+ antiporter NhaC